MTHTPTTIDDSIERAAATVGSVWPIHSFVTANPLSGFESRPFHQAVAAGERLFGGRGYPTPSVFRRALESGRIDPDVLDAELTAHGITRSPEELLSEMTDDSGVDTDVAPETEAVDRILSKWLAAFLDSGQATWAMPDREKGFYTTWRELAPYDDDVPNCDDASALPESATAALESILDEYSEERQREIIEFHLVALPGWTGVIKQRETADADPWQSAAPISLRDYLAVRLVVADLLGAPIEPTRELHEPDAENEADEEIPLAEIWLTAWEKSYRQRLTGDLEEAAEEAANEAAEAAEAAEAEATARPDAQLVFCIDTRSEVIRRHIEATGDYETHGYAGFFGIPMRFRGYGSDVEIDACPPIVDAQHRVTERPTADRSTEAATRDQWSKLVTAGRKHMKSLKHNVAAAFTFVEGAGGAYGAALATRTLLPSTVFDAADAIDERVPKSSAFCTTTHDRGTSAARGDHDDNVHDHEDDHDDHVHDHHADSLPDGMSTDEQASYAETAFELMGFETFARLVVFTGHASQTANNPFGSSLDCGACAGNAGGPNARVLAAICNDEAVQSILRDRGYDIPDDTVFVAAEHNTTTDEVELFDGEVPGSHQQDLEHLREDLADARAGAADERTASMNATADDGVREVERRAADWAETRPEWGLAGNAAFVIGSRRVTSKVNLEGRSFLHSYEWSMDDDGEALAAIMAGPLVVTQWINNQYYFAAVDNATYGSGSKTTQNPVGNVGILQGNGGDLMTGLPLQSLYADDETMYHQPLRLTAVIHAPRERVEAILREHENVRQLLDNGWINLTVMDPTRDDALSHYAGELTWEPAASTESPATPTAEATATPMS